MPLLGDWITSPLTSPRYTTMAAVCDLEELLVIAIDIGTTYSGYAMSFASEKLRIQVIREADSNPDRLSGCPQAGKVPTALLLKPDGSFHSFGFKALRDYDALVDENPDAQKKWMYFERFKMELHTKSVSGSGKVKEAFESE